jgi:glycosyltransferase involved in cell wall biosynthesis
VQFCTGRTYLHHHTLRLSREIGAFISKLLTGLDVIVAPAGSTEIAHLETELPIVYISDTTAALAVGYNPDFKQPFARSLRAIDRIERLALSKCSLALFSSSWAAESARRDYRTPPEKVAVVPFGANLEEVPSSTQLEYKRAEVTCRLLFVGVDWVNKGGPIAYDAFRQLLQMGVPAELTVVGCTPPRRYSHARMHVFPFLDKNQPDERHRLYELYLQSDLFILPTRTECYGIVFCEANAFALPVIGTETGGVSEIVRNGVNGFLLPQSATGQEYALRIKHVISDRAAYLQLRHNSRLQFEQRLNWNVWGQTVNRLICGLMNERASAQQANGCGIAANYASALHSRHS